MLWLNRKLSVPALYSNDLIRMSWLKHQGEGG